MSSFVIHTLMIVAQTGSSPASRPAGGIGDFFAGPMFPMMAVLLIFWIFMANSKRKTERKRKSAMEEMKRGDRVQTIGGILGTIVEVRDGEVLVKVDESNNTKIKFTRSAIHRVVEEEKAENK